MLTQTLPTIPKKKEFCPKLMRTYDAYLHLTKISVKIFDFNIQDFPTTRRKYLDYHQTPAQIEAIHCEWCSSVVLDVRHVGFYFTWG